MASNLWPSLVRKASNAVKELMASLLLLLYTALVLLGLGLAHKQGKVGTGYGFDKISDFRAMHGLSWWYNWGTEPGAEAFDFAKEHGTEFVPMQWSKWGIEDLISSPALQEAKWLLGYNEPNHREQGNLEPAEAAALWPYLQEAAEKYSLRLGAPSAAPCGTDCITPNPFDWWDEFFSACKDCRVDMLPIHIYSCNGDAVGWFIEECKQRYRLPIWVTEFACPIGPGPHTVSQQIFMAAALQKLDSDPAVERYAWFAPRVTDGWVGESASLLQQNKSELSHLGRQYMSDRLPDASDPLANALQRPGAVWSERCKSCFDIAAIRQCQPDSCIAASGSTLCCLCQDCGFWPRG